MSEGDGDDRVVKVVADSSFRDMVLGQRSYSTYAGRDTVYIASPRDLFMWENREEIKDTYEIVEVDSAAGVAAAFVRYSVGSDIFREVKWGEEYRGRWFPSYGSYGYFSEGSRFTSEQQKQLEEIDAQATEWENNGATVWELE